jgi:hypothetical protein
MKISKKVETAEALFLAMIRNAKFSLSAMNFAPEEIIELESFTRPYRDKLNEIEAMEREINDTLK